MGQLLLILNYGSELHQSPSEEASMLARKFARWVAMGYQKIEDITGISKLQVLTHRKRVRWAASVYARFEPELRPRAERILSEELGGEADVILKWVEGIQGAIRGGREATGEATLLEEKIGYTDGSRMEGAAAAATAESAIFLGNLATVMDADVLGIAGAWEEGYTVVKSDSQAAIKRCQNLVSGAQEVRSWIDERVVREGGRAKPSVGEGT